MGDDQSRDEKQNPDTSSGGRHSVEDDKRTATTPNPDDYK
jgi:hypothetical protein